MKLYVIHNCMFFKLHDILNSVSEPSRYEVLLVSKE